MTHTDVQLNGRRYRVTYYSDGQVSDVLICDVRTRERGQPRGAWALDGVRRLRKSGPTAQAVLALARSQTSNKED